MSLRLPSPLPTSPAATRWFVLLALLGLLGACGTTRPQPGKGAPEAAALTLEIDAPDEIEDLLRRHLDLARLGVLAPGEPLQEGELERLLAGAPDQVRALLRTEGYFGPDVRIEHAGGAPPRVALTVRPGPQAVVDDVHLDVAGPLEQAARGGGASARAAQRTLAALHEAWPLPPGTPFRDTLWGRAKGGAIAQVRAAGYLGAQWTRTEARVDARAHRVTLTLALDSGPLHRTGPMRIEGLNHHDARTVHNLAAFGPGTPATETLLLDFQERMQGAALFERASVSYEPAPGAPEATPVVVRVSERKLQQATFGIGIDANVGAQASVEHVHRRPLGRAWVARNKADVAQRRQRWEGEVGTHALAGLYRNLVGAAAERVESDTDVETLGRVRVGRAQETRRISRFVFAEVERSTVRSALPTERAESLALHYHGVWRSVDDVLLPTRGHVWSAQAGAGAARSRPGGNGPFARAHVRWTGYRPVGDWYAQARVELGQVFARGGLRVPAGLRFRAGGDESVRGYAYRSLAPVVDGVEVSGDVLFTASAELARPLLRKLPELWGAVFVDAGDAALRWREIEPAYGYGVGLRYRSPIGPVKLDLAWGEAVRRLRLHLTVGVSF